MPRTTAHFWLTALLSLIFLAAIPQDALSADIPFASNHYETNVREEPIEDFLRNLFWEQGLSVSVDPDVTGKINGKFSGHPAEIFEFISNAYSLIPFYDGNMVYVYSAGKLQKRIINLSPEDGRHIQKMAGELRLLDQHNNLRTTSNGALIVSGTPAFVSQIDEFVNVLNAKSADVRLNQDHLRIFPLKYAWADDRQFNSGEGTINIPGVASILRSIVSNTQNIQQDHDRHTDSSDDTRHERSNSTVPRTPSVRSSGNGSDESNGAPRYRYLPNQPRIEADIRMNAIIVRDSVDRMPMYEQFIATLDVAPQLVEIQATILDVDMQKMNETGVQWNFLDNDGRFNIRSTPSSNAFQTGGLGVTNPFANGLLASGIVGDNDILAVRVAALQQEGLAKVVSRPQILTLSNVEAVFNNLETLFLPVFGEREVDLFDVSAGTELRVTPHVVTNPNDTSIRLVVNVRDGQVVNRGAASGFTGGGVGASIIESGVSTTALIQVGESLLIGGMTVNETEQIENKVPGLGNIPLLGRAFKSTTESTRRFERLILITPRLVGHQAPPTRQLDISNTLPKWNQTYTSGPKYSITPQYQHQANNQGQHQGAYASARHQSPVNTRPINTHRPTNPNDRINMSYCRKFKRCPE